MESVKKSICLNLNVFIHTKERYYTKFNYRALIPSSLINKIFKQDFNTFPHNLSEKTEEKKHQSPEILHRARNRKI